MFRNKIILISLLSLAVVLALTFALFFFKPQGEIKQNIGDNKASSGELSAVATSTLCQKLPLLPERDRCLNKNGLLYLDMESCNLITDISLKKGCRDVLGQDQAVKDKNLDGCLNLSGKDECMAIVLGVRDGWNLCVQNNDRTGCLEKLFTGEAIKKSNPLICQALLKPENCLTKVSAAK